MFLHQTTQDNPSSLRLRSSSIEKSRNYTERKLSSSPSLEDRHRGPCFPDWQTFHYGCQTFLEAFVNVSCLSEFKNLQSLDLGFNNLTSLEGLKLCMNLKWLSVVQNKLQLLKGIEGLIKLTVLNSGKNKLKSMDEVSGLVNLRALILNDNDIVSICKLDKMKELNTLVLSRNPISGIVQSLAKINSSQKY
ncbi:hypothetical protein K7X08_028459 [Anisodus acutangulus]|uniref:Uncharacterized protein n=1 Tax=Anisodus acutangulus TaxID=402998 RepID=A0A9Q1M8F9_9SOLA|nr:hypothetical protein K7X08_028459 [Anisodus acutangulus]